MDRTLLATVESSDNIDDKLSHIYRTGVLSLVVGGISAYAAYIQTPERTIVSLHVTTNGTAQARCKENFLYSRSLGVPDPSTFAYKKCYRLERDSLGLRG